MVDTSTFLIKHMIIGRTASDPEYRTALLADPDRMLAADQIERDSGRTLAPGKRLRVVEETENSCTSSFPSGTPSSSCTPGWPTTPCWT